MHTCGLYRALASDAYQTKSLRGLRGKRQRPLKISAAQRLSSYVTVTHGLGAVATADLVCSYANIYVYTETCFKNIAIL